MLFYKNYTVYILFTYIGFYHFTKFRLLYTFEIANTLSEGVLLFYKTYLVFYNDYHIYFGVLIEKHVYTKFHRDGWLCQ